MNDLILQARLHEAQELEKALGMGQGRITSKLPGIGGMIDRRGMSDDQKANYNQNTKDISAQKVDARNAARQQHQGSKGRSMNPIGSEVSEGVDDQANIDAGSGTAQMTPIKPMGGAGAAPAAPGTETPPAQPEGTASVGGLNGNPTVADQTTVKTTNNADGTPQEVKTTQTMNNASSGQSSVNPQVQGMAQQFQAGQDMQAVQQGKGAKKQTWMNSTGIGRKLLDIGTLGATAAAGQVGRNKANAQSQEQTQQFNQAQGRMNQRAMGTNPVMTSFDSPSSAYTDLGEMLSIRKSIQERTTTDNLRRV